MTVQLLLRCDCDRCEGLGLDRAVLRARKYATYWLRANGVSREPYLRDSAALLRAQPYTLHLRRIW